MCTRAVFVSREKRQKKRDKEREERLTREKEEALLDPERAPETADEFERLVASSPNSSYVWIKYMALHLQMTDVDRAREVSALNVVRHSDRDVGKHGTQDTRVRSRSVKISKLWKQPCWTSRGWILGVRGNTTDLESTKTCDWTSRCVDVPKICRRNTELEGFEHTALS